MLTAINQQIRAASLGFWPGGVASARGSYPPEVFDGALGPLSRAAISRAAESQRQRGRPFAHPTGIIRIHWHWTVGFNKASDVDKEHYHWVFEGDGKAISCHPDTTLLAHTKDANTGAVGLSLCGMVGAKEKPFTAGPEPFSAEALRSMIHQSALLTEKYDIPVSRWSTLSHAEVQQTLGIKQRQKWDIAWLPGQDMPLPALVVGERLREMVRAERVRLGFGNPPASGGMA